MTNLTIATIALLLGTLVLLFVINKGVDVLLSRRITDEDSLISVSLVKGGFFISAALVLSQVFESVQTITIVLSSRFGTETITWEQLHYFAIFTGIALAFTIACAALSLPSTKRQAKGKV